MQPAGGTVSCGDGGARHAFQMQRSALHFGALYFAIVPARRSKRWGTEGQATGDTIYLSFAPPLKCGCCFSLAEKCWGKYCFCAVLQKTVKKTFEGIWRKLLLNSLIKSYCCGEENINMMKCDWLKAEFLKAEAGKKEAKKLIDEIVR